MQPYADFRVVTPKTCKSKPRPVTITHNMLSKIKDPQLPSSNQSRNPQCLRDWQDPPPRPPTRDKSMPTHFSRRIPLSARPRANPLLNTVVERPRHHRVLKISSEYIIGQTLLSIFLSWKLQLSNTRINYQLKVYGNWPSYGQITLFFTPNYRTSFLTIIANLTLAHVALGAKRITICAFGLMVIPVDILP